MSEQSKSRSWLQLKIVLAGALFALTLLGAASKAQSPQPTAEIGRAGGRITVALRTDPKTLNPILAVDTTSREVIGAMQADLVHINRQTQRTESALASSWKVSTDGHKYTLQLRHDVKFSDGAPFTADDVVFTFQLYLDEALNSPQRDLLVIDNKPIAVKKIDNYTVEFDLTKPYGPGERIFDSLAILPKHSLEAAYRDHKIGEVWGVNAKPEEIAGLGPFRLKSYVAGQQLLLERNPNYWRKDARGKSLPYLNELLFTVVANEDAQVIKFKSGETQILERVGADNFNLLQKDSSSKSLCLSDVGPGLEFVFLLLNMNSVDATKHADIAAKELWFRDLKFREAVSLAMDRKGMVRLVYGGRATPIWGNVSPGNRLWLSANIQYPERSIDQAKALLKSDGFSWDANGALLDSQKHPVTFTVVVSSSNAQRTKIATVAQDDLKQLGIDVRVVPLEFRALVDRVMNTHDYDAVLMNLVNGDVDPTPEMGLWRYSGEMHLWDMGEKTAATPWEAELDKLMESQMTTTDYATRKKLYDRVQEIVAQNLPLVFLLSPDILVGAQSTVGNFRPGILDPYALWNVDEQFIRPTGATCH
ncbi:MAG TPA: ABC transporter substrate-binding protein [Candidatus Acidoferrum sp.]|jgi:peptide/nickel transport system substrate-binding protein